MTYISFNIIHPVFTKCQYYICKNKLYTAICCNFYTCVFTTG